MYTALIILALVFLPMETHTEESFSSALEEPLPYLVEVDPMDDLLEDLAFCESTNNPNELNPDDGGSRSVGLLQFKDGTFMFFSDVYDLGYVPEDIYDPEKQKILAKLMISDGLWYHWKNCFLKMGLEQGV